jgi:hypothetical protein
MGAGAYLYFSVFGGSAPAAVSLSQPTASTVPTGGTPFDGSFDGTWSVDTTSGSSSDFTDSFAGLSIADSGTVEMHLLFQKS